MSTESMSAASRQVQIAYDRTLHCTPIHDDVTDQAICGVGFRILFDHQFNVTTMDSEPAGADELNAMLKVSYSPDSGFSFHPSSDDLGWRVSAYELLVDQPNNLLIGKPIDRNEFERFMAETAQRFDPDPSLQSGSYALVEAPELGPALINDRCSPQEDGEERTIPSTPVMQPISHFRLVDDNGDEFEDTAAEAPDPAFDAYIEWLDADGWRTVEPKELGHLSAEEARNLGRTYAGMPPETTDERLAAEAILVNGAHITQRNLGRSSHE